MAKNRPYRQNLHAFLMLQARITEMGCGSSVSLEDGWINRHYKIRKRVGHPLF
jgi:hypothetical protein